MKDPAIVLSRFGHARPLRIELAGVLARTIRIEPKCTTFEAEQLAQWPAPLAAEPAVESLYFRNRRLARK